MTHILTILLRRLLVSQQRITCPALHIYDSFYKSVICLQIDNALYPFQGLRDVNRDEEKVIVGNLHFHQHFGSDTIQRSNACSVFS